MSAGPAASSRRPGGPGNPGVLPHRAGAPVRSRLHVVHEQRGLAERWYAPRRRATRLSRQERSTSSRRPAAARRKPRTHRLRARSGAACSRGRAAEQPDGARPSADSMPPPPRSPRPRRARSPRELVDPGRERVDDRRQRGALASGELEAGWRDAWILSLVTAPTTAPTTITNAEASSHDCMVNATPMRPYRSADHVMTIGM